MANHTVVSSDEWLVARKELLKKEKELTRQRDQITQLRQELPWRTVDKPYEFEGPRGKLTLADLFANCSQLLVYHFMFDPDWEEGCKSCSLIADHYDPLVVHLSHRDVSLVTVSRASLEKLLAFRERMGWSFPWVSSLESEFNWDFNVSFKPEDVEAGSVEYNFQQGVNFPSTEGPGMSTFCKDEAGTVFHTYSVFGRGLEDLLGVYRFLDLVPKGRDEDDLSYGMEWVRHRDRYGDVTFIDPYIQ